MSSDLQTLYLARGLRGFGDGFATIRLPAYLTAIGYDPIAIGIVLTASLLGTALFTLAIGAIAPRHDLRTLMLAGALLMVLTGMAFPNFQHIAFVAFVAFVGTINPSTSDLGVLIPLEHAMLARGVSDEERTHAFARYSLIGTLSMACGTLAAAAPDFLTRAGLPQLDAFSGGFVVQSLLALWLFEHFHLSVSSAGVFFFCASMLSAFSYPVAAWMAGYIGLIHKMVFTHIPSSIFLILAAFSSNLYVVLGLLLLRSALSQMDVPTRTSYVMAVVTPAERATAASVTSGTRSLASSVSPTFSGVLLPPALPGLPLIVCGVGKIIYDLALLYSFRHVKPPEEVRETAPN